MKIDFNHGFILEHIVRNHFGPVLNTFKYIILYFQCYIMAAFFHKKLLVIEDFFE